MRKPTLYRHRGAWYARFWNENDGRYFSRALNIKVEGKKERRAEAAEAALKMARATAEEEAEKPAPPPDPPRASAASGTPLLEYVENFWKPDGEYAREKALVEKKPLSAQYLYAKSRTVELKIKPFPGFAGLTLGGLTKPVIRQWKLWMAERGYSGDAVNKAAQALGVPVRRAFGDDVIPSDPFAGLRRAAHEEKIRGILTPPEIKRLVLSEALDPRTRLAVFLPLYCSMRLGEVRGLQWGDISDGIIHICHNWQEGEGLKPCKCGSEGYVPMPGVVADMVNQVHAIAPLTGPGDFVMAQKPYHPACREFLWEALRFELFMIGITEKQRVTRNIVYHSLRHSFVTACRIAGLSDFETMTLSRHKDVKMLQRYSHGREALDVRRMGEKLERSLLPGPCATAAHEG